MRTLSKVVFSAVLVCLLLSSAAGGRSRHDDHANHIDRVHPRAAVRLRRLNGDSPSHHPVRPSPTAAIPPDDDDDDENRLRFAASDCCEFVARHSEPLAPHSRSEYSTARIRLDRPLYQTLRTLLI